MTEKEQHQHSNPAVGQAGRHPRRRFAQGAQLRQSAALNVRRTLWGLGGMLAAFLLGRCALLFDARPLGIALLCAATHAIPYIWGGLVISALTADGGRVILICAYTAALLIRILSRSAIDLPGAGRGPSRTESETGNSDGHGAGQTLHRRLADRLRIWIARGEALMTHWFSESIYLRMMTACVCAFLVSLYTIISGGFLYYDLFGAIFAMVTAPVATLLYAGLFPAGEWDGTDLGSDKKSRRILRLIAPAALVFSLMLSLRQASIYGFSLCACVGFTLTLCVTRRRGTVQGIGAGILCGLAYSPALVPSFALGAAVFRPLAHLSPLLAALLSCAVGVAWGAVPLGGSVMTEFLPAILAGSLLTCAADKLLTRPSLLMTPLPDAVRLEAAERADVDHQRAAQSEERMRALAETFSSLAEIFYSLSDRLRRPGLLDLRRMCDHAFDAVCPECPDREICWGADYVGTLTRLSRMSAALYERGQVTHEDMGEEFLSRCPSADDLRERMNGECARMTEMALRTEKAEIFAMDFDGLSHILNDALQEQDDDFLYDEVLSEQVQRALTAIDLRCEGVLVFGKRRKQIVARGIDATTCTWSSESIRRRLEETLDCLLADLTFDLNDTGVTMRAQTRPRYTVRRVMRTMAAKGGICGDTVNVFDTEREMSYALISDGMGTGQEAAFTSGMCSLFLEKMLTAGNHAETSLRMLNSMIRQKGGGIGMECTATVDLMELDCLCGRAVFLKSGASPTYVRRGDDLFRLHAQTAPIGILRTVDAQRISYDIHPGDVIIMLSDGICPEDGGEEVASEGMWLLDLLSDGWEDQTDVMAERILNEARRRGSEDDLSVILMEVREVEVGL